MKKSRWIVPALALAFAAVGCILTTGQFFVNFDLDNITVSTDSQVASEYVDLNTISAYSDHKDQLEGVSDLAVLGTIFNTGATGIDVQVWMTPDSTGYSTPSQVTTNATLLWGPFAVSAGDSATIGWVESTKLFSSTGKSMLIDQVKGDGEFTVYVISPGTNYSFDVDNGVLVVVIEAGL